MMNAPNTPAVSLKVTHLTDQAAAGLVDLCHEYGVAVSREVLVGMTVASSSILAAIAAGAVERATLVGAIEGLLTAVESLASEIVVPAVNQ